MQEYKGKAICYTTYESDNEFIIENFKDLDDAWDCVVSEFPRVLERYKKEDMELTSLSRCLDCDSSWIEDEDRLCGECGEQRLSKIKKPVYYLSR